MRVVCAFQLRVKGAVLQDWVSWANLQRQFRVIVGRLVKRRDRVFKKEIMLLAHQLLLSWKRWVEMVASVARLKLLGKEQMLTDAFCAWAQECGHDHSVESTAQQFRDVMCSIMQQPPRTPRTPRGGERKASINIKTLAILPNQAPVNP